MKKRILFALSICSLFNISHSQTKPSAPNPASSFTADLNNSLYNYLDFNDKKDYENANKGLIAKYPNGTIGETYNFKEYDFIKGKSPETANPSLWRQSELNAIAGLFKVSDNIYQIRGFDLANMSLVKGKTGWIIIDPLTVAETAKTGMELVKKHIGDYPVSAVIVTHSHIDHFGGMRAVVNEQDVKSGKIKIYAPEGFLDHSVSENVMAGNAMSRRALYMYGSLLPKNPNGSLGSGLGTTTAKGMSGILDATDFINSKEGETREIDGVKVEFIFTPESEAPSEMMFYFPEFKAFMQAEDLNHTLHNLYSLRGTQVRNGQKWSTYIDKAIEKWGKDMQVSFGSHHWPTWGNSEVLEFMEGQRDLYRFIHDQTLRLANQGYTPIEIGNTLKLPKSLDTKFYNRSYYGTVSHDARAQYQLYFGFFDGNPANLDPLSPQDEGKRFIEMMGGSANVLKKAQEYYKKGDYRWTAKVLNYVVFAEPNNQAARNLLGDTYEQLGYQAESAPWRNFYLSGAQDLRSGKKSFKSGSTASPDILNNMTTELFFNYLAMRYDGVKENTNKYNFNFNLTDTNEKVGVILSNGTVNTRIGHPLTDKITASITGPRKILMAITSGQAASIDKVIADGTVKIEGDQAAAKSFFGNIQNFDLWFNIVEP